MKRLFSVLTSAVIAAVTAVFPLDLSVSAANSVRTATDIYNDITVGWNLGDDLDCYRSVAAEDENVYEQYWGCPSAAGNMIRDIHAAGFNTIRIPVTWEQKLDENDRIADFWMDRVQEVVDYAYDDGMYVILNIHHDTNFGWLSASEDAWNEHRDRFTAIWQQISDRFADYDGRLMFEGFNEILNDEGDWGFWDDDALARRDDAIIYTNKWNQLFVDTVRAGSGYNPDRVLICNTYAASCVENVLNGSVRFELPEDTVTDRLITDVHFYQPYDFVDDPNGKTAYEKSDKLAMQAAVDVISENLSGLILIDEFGTRSKGNTADRAAFTSDFMQVIGEKGYKSCVWDSGLPNNEFGLYNRWDGTWYFPEIAEAILNGAGVRHPTLKESPDYSQESNLTADPYGFSIWSEGAGLNYISSCDPSGIELQVLNGGNDLGDIVLVYKYAAYEKGKTYRISFDISCNGTNAIQDGLFESGYMKPDYSDYQRDFSVPLSVTSGTLHQSFEYTPSWTHSATLNFYLQSGKNDAYTVSISNLSVTESKNSDGISAHDVVDEISIGYNLANGFDCFTDAELSSPELYEWAWGNAPADAQTIKDIHDAGFDAVRLPITWGQHCDSNMNIDSAWIDRIKEVVNDILANDMYCIINIHHDTNLGWLSADMGESGYKKFEKLWTNIAAAFADYDERLIFEGYNEINGKDSDGNVIWGFYGGEDAALYEHCISAANKLNQIFVDTVRASGGNNPDRVLLCNTYGANASTGTLRGFEMPQDTAVDKLIAGVHVYEPWDFCSYDNMYVTRYTDASYDTDFPHLQNLRELWVDNPDFPYPVIIGEMGTEDKNNLDARNEWMTEYLSRTEDMGVKCFVWDDGQHFQLYSRIMHAWKYPDHVKKIMELVGKKSVLNAAVPVNKYNLGGETDRFHILGISPAYAKTKSLSVEDNTFTAEILSGGNRNTDIHAEYHGMQLDSGTTYHVSFDAVCAGITELDAALEIGVLKTTSVIGESFVKKSCTLSNELQHFEFDFTPRISDTDSVYSCGVFYLGGGKGEYAVTISNFTVVSDDVPDMLQGDVNMDGVFNIADVVFLQKWLLAFPNTHLANWKAADLFEDNRLDVFDLCLMKRALLARNATRWEVVDMGTTEYRFISDTSIDVTVTDAGEDTWWAQVYLPTALKAGATYEVQYTIQADAKHLCNICIQRNSGEYETYYYNEMTATTKAQTVTERFTADQDCPNAKLGFNLGYEPGEYHISGVKLVQVK